MFVHKYLFFPLVDLCCMGTSMLKCETSGAEGHEFRIFTYNFPSIMDSRVGKIDFVYRTVKYSNSVDCACTKITDSIKVLYSTDNSVKNIFYAYK